MVFTNKLFAYLFLFLYNLTILILVIFMIIRLGYVSISKCLEETCSHTISYTNYLKEDKKLDKLHSIILSNLNSLNNIINYNIKNNIHFFRISSNLIPLATKDDVKFDYINPYKNFYSKIGKIINNNNIRVDFHPDEFCVINSVKEEVKKNTLEILKYHYNILEALNIKNKVLIVHIGSNVFGKEKSIQRFINTFNSYPTYIKKCIAIENDDKIFNIKDTLELCEKIGCPMVLDYHHYLCNSGDLDINLYYERIFNTWKNINPKIHFSSPKNKTKKDFRSHHDYINVDNFISFLNQIKHLNYNIDVMLEAKAKDDALFRLVRGIKYKTNYSFIDETSFRIY